MEDYPTLSKQCTRDINTEQIPKKKKKNPEKRETKDNLDRRNYPQKLLNPIKAYNVFPMLALLKELPMWCRLEFKKRLSSLRV